MKCSEIENPDGVHAASEVFGEHRQDPMTEVAEKDKASVGCAIEDQFDERVMAARVNVKQHAKSEC